MQWNAKWIRPVNEMGDICPLFQKKFSMKKKVAGAELAITALGVYEAQLNGKRIGEAVLTPGWTTYGKRLQYQIYDVKDLLQEDNAIEVTVGKGWYRSPLVGWEESKIQKQLQQFPAGLLVQLQIQYEDGTQEVIVSDETWRSSESRVRFSEIYDGEIYDASFVSETKDEVGSEVFDGPYHTLIAQQGEAVKEQEWIQPLKMIHTPKGEVVIDFGQEVTGYVEISLTAKSGEKVRLSHAEVLDKEGNFYTDNYRSAKADYQYICRDGEQNYKPKLTFYGFRYIRVDEFPGGADKASLCNFTAVVIYSDIKRTGYLSCSDPRLNQLFENIFWGQKGNFVDIPTDCPQRDERLGWTGDAQVFVKTAALNYDVETFFTKWLADLAADQGEDGRVGHVIPDLLGAESSTAWGDAATICPWEIYLAYGNDQILRNQYESMKKWVDYIGIHTTEKNLWTGGEHFGDWLGLDAPSGSYKGSTREDFIATAFYAHSTELLIKAGKRIGREVAEYEALYQGIVHAFQERFPVYKTQTECVLAVHFGISPDCQKAADQLAEMVTAAGGKLQTGFVGAPYLLHVLSSYGHLKLAYDLLLREQYPSWLYSVSKGATTIWEHWDGIMENGDFWSTDMNSYNHYAYGAVADWVYTVAAGIRVMEDYPGYEKVIIAPNPDERLGWLKASLMTRNGLIRSEWKKYGDMWRYEIETPVDADIVIAGQKHKVKKGIYTYYSEQAGIRR